MQINARPSAAHDALVRISTASSQMTASARKVAERAKSQPGATPVEPEMSLAASSTQAQALAAAVYHAAIAGANSAELLQMTCVQLAERLGAPLVMLLRKAQNGRFAIEGTSSHGDLCVALHRVPECWDGGVASGGPARAALLAGGPVRMSFKDDGLALWRAAADQDRITDVIACPMEAGGSIHVLEIFSRMPLQSEATKSGVTIRSLKQGMETLIADIGEIQRQRLLARSLEAAGNATFITDNHGAIVWSNAAFSTLTGYEAHEVQGRNPSFLQSGKQSVRYYRDLWSTIRSGKAWSGETVDRDKDGNLYTIRQTISPVALEGRVSHYVSIHEDISQQKRHQRALELATGTDPRTGLMTRAAFEAGARDTLSTLSARQHGAELLVFSLRGLRRAAASLDANAAGYLAVTMGRRLREANPAPQLAAEVDAYEYAVLISDDQLAGTSILELVDAVRKELAEPILYLGDSLDVDVHCGRASYPSQASTLEQLWSMADRQLADEPVARAHPARPH